MTDLLERRLLVVTGKGGTGKTTMAAALARLAARSGKRVLLCEIDATGDIVSPFSATLPAGQTIGFEPLEVEPGLFVMQMDTEAALHEYLRLNLKMPVPMRLGGLARAFDFVATAAPGVREILTIGKLCWEVKRENYDLVIADAAATGHVVGQLDAPTSIGELISVGPLVSQTAWMREMLRDPRRTGAVLVATPEEMPVSETLDLADQLAVRTQTPIAAVIVNRVLPELFVRDDERRMRGMVDEPVQRAALSAIGGPGVDHVLVAADLGAAFRRAQVQHLHELQSGLADVPMLFVPHAMGDPDAMVNGNPSAFVLDALAAEIE